MAGNRYLFMFVASWLTVVEFYSVWNIDNAVAINSQKVRNLD